MRLGLLRYAFITIKGAAMNTVYLFPGQGAQYPGMGRDFYNNDSRIRELFEEASVIAGRNWAKTVFEGTEEELRSTDVTQIAIVLVNVAASITLASYGIKASSCAGFSLGEYTALYEAEVLSQGDLLRVVDARGKILEKFSRLKDGNDGPVGMTAVLGLTIDEVEEGINGIDDVYIGLHSSLNQTVLSGTAAGLSAAEDRLEKAGAMKLVRLKVSGPFHSPLLKDAKAEFKEVLESVEFSDPKIPVFVNTEAKSPRKGADMRKACLEQIDHPVRWVDCQRALMDTNPQRVLEVGPGKVLCGLWKSTKNSLRAQPAGTLSAIKELL